MNPSVVFLVSGRNAYESLENIGLFSTLDEAMECIKAHRTTAGGRLDYYSILEWTVGASGGKEIYTSF